MHLHLNLIITSGDDLYVYGDVPFLRVYVRSFLECDCDDVHHVHGCGCFLLSCRVYGHDGGGDHGGHGDGVLFHGHVHEHDHDGDGCEHDFRHVFNHCLFSILLLSKILDLELAL